MAEDRNGLGTIFFGDGHQLLRRLVQRLFPGHFLEFALAALARTHHGRLEAVGVVHKGDAALTAGAEHAPALGIRRVAVDLENLSIDAGDDHAATPRAHAAAAVALLDLASRKPGRIQPTAVLAGCQDRHSRAGQGKAAATCRRGLQKRSAGNLQIYFSH